MAICGRPLRSGPIHEFPAMASSQSAMVCAFQAYCRMDRFLAGLQPDPLLIDGDTVEGSAVGRAEMLPWPTGTRLAPTQSAGTANKLVNPPIEAAPPWH